MQTSVAALSTAFACSLALTPVVRDHAVRRGLLDHGITSRKIHGRPVPRLGGVAIVTSFFAALGAAVLLIDAAPARAEPAPLAGLLAGGLAIAALGVYDDVRGASARGKFAVQFTVAAFVWALGVRIEIVSLPLVGEVAFGPLAFPVTLLWIAGVTNALNLIDGLDGLAAGVSAVAGTALFVLGAARGDRLLMICAAALVGGALGFLRFNHHPASVFMGDTGSMFLGFVLAVLSLRTGAGTQTVATIVPLLVLGYPLLDTLLAMARRAARGVPLFSADRGHIHHRLLARGLSHAATTAVLWVASACLCFAALVVASAPAAWPSAVALVTFGSLATLRWLGFLEWRKLPEVAAAHRRNRERRQRVRGIASRLARAADAEAIRGSLAEVGPALHVDHVALKVDGHAWTFTPAPTGSNLHLVHYGLEPAGAEELEVGWVEGSSRADRDAEIAIEQLCPYVRAAVRRIGAKALETIAPCSGSAGAGVTAAAGVSP